MRVLQVVHQFLPDYVGGTELYVAQLCRWLTAQGHQVALLTGGDMAGDTVWEGMPVTTVPGGLRGPKGPGGLFLTGFRSPTAESAFRRLLAGFRPDVVHLHHLIGLSGRLPALAHAAGTPVCATLHDYWFLCPKSQLIDYHGDLCAGPRLGVNCARCAIDRLGMPQLVPLAPLAAPVFALRQAQVRRAFAACDLLMAPSRFLAGMAVDAGLPADRIVPVDFGLEDAAQTPRSERQPAAPLRVAYLGSIDESKGVHVLLEACARLDPAIVSVGVHGNVAAAPAPYRQRLQALAAATAFGPRVLRGPVAHSAVPALLASTDVLVVPSIWYENAPLVISEALAVGAVVVASNQGALAEKVRDGVNGLLFPRADAVALAATLQRLAADRQLLERLQQTSSPPQRREGHWRHLLDAYQHLAARRPSPWPDAAE